MAITVKGSANSQHLSWALLRCQCPVGNLGNLPIHLHTIEIRNMPGETERGHSRVSLSFSEPLQAPPLRCGHSKSSIWWPWLSSRCAAKKRQDGSWFGQVFPKGWSAIPWKASELVHFPKWAVSRNCCKITQIITQGLWFMVIPVTNHDFRNHHVWWFKPYFSWSKPSKSHWIILNAYFWSGKPN